MFAKTDPPPSEPRPPTEQAASSTERAVHFNDAASPTPPAHGSPATQSRENLMESRNMSPSPQPQQQQQQYAPPPGYPPAQPYYNGYESYSAQQPYAYANANYQSPPPHQAVPVAATPQRFWYKRAWSPVFTYLTALAMVGLLGYELFKNHQLTGSVIQTSPFNIMIGPSASTLIQVGARYVPCMHATERYPIDAQYQCPNTTNIQAGTTAPSLRPVQTNVTISGAPCTLQEVCGISTFADPAQPDQWYRFITAIFIHSGVVHWLFNMFVHMSLGASMERLMNPLRYAVVWLASGAFGFIFGGVFSPPGNASVGCSGALFGVVALLFIDLFTQWRLTLNPWWEFTKLVFLILFSFVWGLLPGLDNFAHIGGFVCGLLAGIIFFPIPTANRTATISLWVVRIVLLGGLVGMFYGMIHLFYSGRNSDEICSWCKYLACLPIADMCDAYYTS